MFAFSFCVSAKRKKRDISFENEEGLKGNARICLYSEKVECLHGNTGGFKTHGGSRAHRATADSHRSRRSAPRHDAAHFPKLFMFAFSICITAKRKKREDYFHRKTVNAKSAVLKNAIKPPEYYTFSEDISGEIIFSRNRILITDWIKIGHARNQTKFP